MKWDYVGNGLINSVDLGNYADSTGANQREMYCYDCDGNRNLNSVDLGYYEDYEAASLP